MSALVDPTTGEVVADCTPDEARQLTERIRSTAAALWQLLASRRHGAARSQLDAVELAGDLQIIEVPAPAVAS